MDPPLRPRRRLWIEAGIVTVLLVLFVCCVIRHSRSASPTHDETWHLSAGYTYWLWNDYRMSPDHPPLLRKLAALPLLWLNTWPAPADLRTDKTSACLRLLVSSWRQGLTRPEGCWGVNQLMFYSVRDETLERFGVQSPFEIPTTARIERAEYYNDTDALVFAGRLPILLLGLLLALLVYGWARELYGVAGGVLALAFCCFDPNIIAHSGLVTADIGTTVFMFGTVYCFWRTCRRLSWANLLLTGLCFGLANASKTSVVLLLPILAALGAVRIGSREHWLVNLAPRFEPVTPGRRAVAVAGVAVVAAAIGYGVLWAAYGFRYSAAYDPVGEAKLDTAAPGAGHFPIEQAVHRSAALRHLLAQHTKAEADDGFTNEQVAEAVPVARLGAREQTILFAQRHRLLPEAYLYGMVGFSQPTRRTSFLRGEYSNDGFPSYFAWTFLLKTPVVTLAAIGLALFFARRGRQGWHRLLFLLVPVGIFFAACVLSRLNIGHRHLLPIYPFLFVLCGGLALEWNQWQPRTRRWTAIAALAAIAISANVVFAPPWKPAVVHPHYLAYFNELAGGPRNGHKSLVDSNLDWGQDLEGVKRWLDRQGITEPIHLCYFGVADARFYQFPHLHLPGTYDTAPSIPFEQARRPGYLALSATHLQGLYFSEAGRAAWKTFLANATLVDKIGYSIFIYRLE